MSLSSLFLLQLSYYSICLFTMLGKAGSHTFLNIPANISVIVSLSIVYLFFKL